jgi:hypothetical protein
MSEPRCVSMFLGVRCQEWADHPGDHYTWDSSTHVTTWDDRAADGWTRESA